jgi:hypothetical protein
MLGDFVRHANAATAWILAFALTMAQERTRNYQVPTSSDWVVTIGGWRNLAPKYDGSDDYVFGGRAR